MQIPLIVLHCQLYDAHTHRIGVKQVSYTEYIILFRCARGKLVRVDDIRFTLRTQTRQNDFHIRDEYVRLTKKPRVLRPMG